MQYAANGGGVNAIRLKLQLSVSVIIFNRIAATLYRITNDPNLKPFNELRVMNPALMVVEVRGIELPSKQPDSWFESNPDCKACRFQSSLGHIADFYAGEDVRSGSDGRQKGAPVFLFQLKKGDAKKLSRFCGLLRPALRRVGCLR
jgi:hypothetical protein